MSTPLPPGLPIPPQGGHPQQVVYHVYQLGAPETGINIATGSTTKAGFIKFLKALLLFTLWAVWVIYIAGIAFTQQTCNAGSDVGAFWPSLPPAGSLNQANCVQYFGLFWWSVWLQFITIVGASILYIGCYSGFKHVLHYFFILSTGLLFFEANSSFSVVWNISQTGNTVSWQWWNGAALLAAGAIGSLIVNFIYLIWYGYVEPPPAATVEEKPEVDVKVEKVEA